MLNICSICLCTGIELHTLEEPLSGFHDEICDFGIDGYTLNFCAICVHMLRKFYNFRNKCQKANKLLNKWKKESKNTRVPLKELNTKLSPTSFSCTDVEHIHCYDDSEGNTESNSNLDNFNSGNDEDSEFVKSSGIKSEKKNADMFETALNVELNDDHYVQVCSPIVSEELKSEPESDHDHINNYDDIVSTNNEINDCYDNVSTNNDINNYDDNVSTNNDINNCDDNVSTNNDINNYDDNVSTNNDINNYDDIVSTNDDINNHEQINTKEVLNKRKNYSELFEDEPKQNKYKQQNISEPDMEEMKRNIKKRLGNDDVKDKDGNVIEADVILLNLDKMHKYTCAKIGRICAGKEPLTPEAINFLGQIKKRYGNQYSSVFVTKHLTTDEEIMEEFRKRETNQNYVQAQHKCTRCFQYFRFAKMLDYHSARYHDPSKPHKCRYCDVTFSERRLLYGHTQTHRVAYQCKLCPLVTNYETSMQVHFNIHTGVKYPCSMCDSVFNSRPTLARHMNNKHAENFTCSHCARKFLSDVGLRKHKQLKHPDDTDTAGPPSAKCEQCDIQFISDEVYLEHQRKSHAGSDGKRARIRKPNRTPKYTCRVCAHIEPNIGALMWHFKSAHPDEEFDLSCIALRDTHKYLCHLCGKGFKTITMFAQHKNVHAGVRPYTCTECPKAFHSKHHLSNHMKFHAPPTYPCNQCGKKFHSRSNLCIHTRSHVGERRYSCQLCGKTFIHQASVNAHVRGVHQHIRRKKKHTKQQTLLEQ